MITGFLIGSTAVLVINSVRLWFDKIELNAKVREAEFQVDTLHNTIDKMVEERKKDFTPGFN